MSKQLLFYEKVTPISKEHHKTLTVEMGNDFSFAKQTNSVPVMAVEIPQASKEYSVVFTESDKAVMPAVVLGIENDANLYVSSDNGWDAKYLPAFVRRYPFVFTSHDEGKTFTLCIDEEYSGFKSGKKAKKGERIFTDDGERTDFLENMLNFVNSYQAEHQRTLQFCSRLKELDLFEPMQAQMTLASGEARSLTGFLAISRDRLKKLDGDVLLELAQNDALELIYLHLASLGNFQSIGERAGAISAAEGT